MKRRTVNAAVSARQPAQRCRCRRIRSSQMVRNHDLHEAARYARRDIGSPRVDILNPTGPTEVYHGAFRAHDPALPGALVTVLLSEVD
mgnify:CR=1 FL=1